VDIFAGSNTTGEAAEILGRNWLAFDSSREYLATSAFRFMQDAANEELKAVYDEIISNRISDLKRYKMQLPFAPAAE